jgi:hypothetical protein
LRINFIFCKIKYVQKVSAIQIIDNGGVAEPSHRAKACVCGRSLAGIVGSNPAGGMDVRLLWVLCAVT